MKESHRKGVANHPDPEPCGGGGNAAPEALDRGWCRLGIPEVDELRKRQSRGADGVSHAGRQYGGVRQRERVTGPAESKTPCMHRNFTRENRETVLPSAAARRRIGGRRR